MTVKLIFPPFSELMLNGPHLAAPLLSSILSFNNIASEAVDLNIRLINRIIEDDVLKYVIDALRVSDERNIGFDIACLQRVRSVNIEQFCRDSSDGLIYALSIIRRVLFPPPISLNECIHDDLRHPMIHQIYSGLIKGISLKDHDVIGFSVAFSEQLAETLQMAKIVRELYPDCRIILGGSQINLLEESQLEALKRTGLFNIIALGNGEIIIKAIVCEPTTNQTRIVRSGPMSETEISNLPTPDFPDTSDYFPPLHMPVLATKGCFWGKCTFCDYVRLDDLGPMHYIARPVTEVLKDIQILKRNYSPSIIMLTSNAVPPAWYKQLAEEAVSKKIKLDTWAYMLHSKELDRSLFKLLSEAGIHTINFGTESTNNRILSLMGKNATRRIIYKNIRDAKDFNIKLTVNCIIDYPTTTFDEAFIIANDFREMLPHINKINPQMFDLTAGTAVSANPNLYNIDIDNSNYINSSHGYHSISFGHTVLTNIDKNILNGIYEKLVSDTCRHKRVSSLNKKGFKDEDILFFDSTTILIEGPPNVLWIISLPLKIPIDDWELHLIREVFDEYGGEIKVGELKSLFHKIRLDSKEGDFTKYLDDISKCGLIVKIRKSEKSIS